jgi:hypothetical protein
LQTFWDAGFSYPTVHQATCEVSASIYNIDQDSYDQFCSKKSAIEMGSTKYSNMTNFGKLQYMFAIAIAKLEPVSYFFLKLIMKI